MPPQLLNVRKPDAVPKCPFSKPGSGTPFFGSKLDWNGRMIIHPLQRSRHFAKTSQISRNPENPAKTNEKNNRPPENRAAYPL
jgi:hypothetical protein